MNRIALVAGCLIVIGAFVLGWSRTAKVFIPEVNTSSGEIISLALGTVCNKEDNVLHPTTVIPAQAKGLCAVVDVDPGKNMEVRLTIRANETERWNFITIYDRNNVLEPDQDKVMAKLKRKKGWPKGSYVVQVYNQDNQMVLRQPFSVK